MLYTTLDVLKNHLGITDNNYDDVLNSIIQQATSIIDSYIGYNLKEKVYKEILDGNGSNKLYFSIIPKEIYKIQNRKTKQNYTLDLIKGYIVYVEENIPKQENIVEVEYLAGYDFPPADIENICLDLATILVSKQTSIQTENLNKLVDKKIKSQKLGSLSITYFGANEEKKSSFDVLNPASNVKQILNKYKKFTGLTY